jgi:hypothetical protein
MNARDPNAVVPSASQDPNADLTAPRDISEMHVSDPYKEVPHVLLAMRDVQAEIAKTGIAKLRKNKEQNYQFRGIDDLYNELCGIMAKAYLIGVPRVVDRVRELGHKTASGKSMICTLVTVEYDFYSAKDGSKVTARTVGEGFDLSDKSSNKSMATAHKYALIQSFNIPVVGNDDADNDDIRIGDKDRPATPERNAKAVDKKGAKTEGAGQQAAKPTLIPEPNGVDPATTVAAMSKALREAPDMQKCAAAFSRYQDSIKKWTTYSPKQRAGWLAEITGAKDGRKAALATPPAEEAKE